ncbi:MAG: 50S ribosomal protein L24 [Candidatus Woesearchaeota archaeon]
MKSAFSINWRSSTKPRKQTKFRANAPLHIRGSFLNVNLSKELRAKYARRNLRVRKEDKVKILRGQFKGKTGLVEKISIANTKVFVAGISLTKKDGAKVPYALNPSNLMILELNLTDKKRMKKLEKRN